MSGLYAVPYSLSIKRIEYAEHREVIFEILGSTKKRKTVCKLNRNRLWEPPRHKSNGCCNSQGKFEQFGESLEWRHNGSDGVSHHQSHHCLFNRLFRRRSKKTSKLRVTGLCAGNSPVTVEVPAQMASNAENVSIWWRHHILHLHKGKC